MTPAAELNRRIDILRVAETSDGGGGRVRTWSDHLRRWAKATPVGGREALVAGTLRNSQGWRIEVRQPVDITVADRIRLDGALLDILSIVDPDGRRDGYVILCQTTTEA